MEGPADPIDHARDATDALASPMPVAASPLPIAVAKVPPIPHRPCRITFQGFAGSEPLRIEVQAWLGQLGALTAPMTGGEVTIEAVDQGRKERCYRVRMDLVMPAGHLIVGADHPANPPHEDFYVAIRNAFRAARRELETRRAGLQTGRDGSAD
jgi:hypothetical protein